MGGMGAHVPNFAKMVLEDFFKSHIIVEILLFSKLGKSRLKNYYKVQCGSLLYIL